MRKIFIFPFKSKKEKQFDRVDIFPVVEQNPFGLKKKGNIVTATIFRSN